MKKTILALALLCLGPALLRADSASDAKTALGDLQTCNSQVQQVQSSTSISNISVNSIQQYAGQLQGMQGYFQSVANDLSRLNLPALSSLQSVALDLQVKLSSASGATTVVSFSALVNALQADCQSWQKLYGPAITALQQAAQQGAQAPAAVATVVATYLPNQAGPTATPLPTNTPAPQATQTVVSVPTIGALPPSGNGGLIPGGYVPQPPTPTAAPTPLPGAPVAGVTPQPLTVRKAPLPVAAGHNGLRAWVANVQTGTVGVFDTVAQRFVAQVPVGANPSSLALDDGDNVLAVANAGSASVTLVDARVDQVLKTIGVGATPAQVLVTHSGKAYVACQDGHSVAIIDLSRRLLLKMLTLTSRPGRMDQPNSSNQVYVSLPDEDSLAIIDTGVDEVVAVVTE
jgi:YVTN family beta-propeller protein